MLLQSTRRNTEEGKCLTQDGSKAKFIRKQKIQQQKNPEKNLNASWLKYLGILAVVHCRGSGLEVLLVKYSLSTLKKGNKRKVKIHYFMQVLNQLVQVLC